MRQWRILLGKEFLEMARNFRFIWVPIAFILLGVMKPVTTYYMPQILDSLGGLPEGAVIEIPTPGASEVLNMSLGQFHLLGVLIIVSITMGMIAGERKSGVAGLILVKPVSYISYITAKWAGAIILVWLSYFLGFLAAWYYVGLLFDWISILSFIKAFFVYGIWLSFVLTVTIFFNAIFTSPGVVGVLSIVSVMVMNFISGAMSHLLEWSPSQLYGYTNEFLLKDQFSSELMPTISITITGIILLLIGCIVVFKKKELAA